MQFYLYLFLWLWLQYQQCILRRYPGEKYIRRFKERLGGGSLRFRVDHPVFGGMYAPDIWPIGGQVVEELTVELPRHLRTGTYSVRLKLVERTLIPNNGIRDFLFDEDGFSGTVCGSLEVRSFIVE